MNTTSGLAIFTLLFIAAMLLVWASTLFTSKIARRCFWLVYLGAVSVLFYAPMNYYLLTVGIAAYFGSGALVSDRKAPAQ